MTVFQVKVSQLPGHKGCSPIVKYTGLRWWTAEERLKHAPVVIAVRTTFKSILTIVSELSGSASSLMDTCCFITSISKDEEHTVALVEPMTRGPYPQYMAMWQILACCTKACNSSVGFFCK